MIDGDAAYFVRYYGMDKLRPLANRKIDRSSDKNKVMIHQITARTTFHPFETVPRRSRLLPVQIQVAEIHRQFQTSVPLQRPHQIGSH